MTTPTHTDHASAVLYPAIERAMEELMTLHPGFNDAVNRAFNHLHDAFWSECPAPASAASKRPEVISCTCGPNDACMRCPPSAAKSTQSAGAIDLQTYIGTKIIGAMPQQNNGADGYMVTYEDGYVSWSPKDAFEKAYRKTGAMTFGDALAMLKKGVMVQRRGVGRVMLVGDANSAVPMLLHSIDSKHGDDDGPESTYEPSVHDMLAEDWQVVE